LNDAISNSSFWAEGPRIHFLEGSFKSIGAWRLFRLEQGAMGIPMGKAYGDLLAVSPQYGSQRRRPVIAGDFEYILFRRGLPLLSKNPKAI
jgi:hypothetical protein